MVEPGPRHILVAGGGPAGVEGALAVQRLARERARITLLADQDAFEYRPTAVAEPFGAAPVQRFSLQRLVAERGFELVRDALDAVDPACHRVLTATGRLLGYELLLLAVGARADVALPGALTFGGPDDVPLVRAALRALHAGGPLRVAFVATPDTPWTLPLYELALLTARWAATQELAVEPWLVTHEGRALGMFGAPASRAVEELLEDAGVRLWTGAFADAVEDGKLWLSLEGGMPVDLAIALARPVGPAITGVPADQHGFTPVDELGRVAGIADVYAAGDMTSRPLKQGGLATQQADAAASAIAAVCGAPIAPQPYRPVLRGMLLTGGRPRFLRRVVGATGAAEPPEDDSPWWPPHKIAGRELAPYLARHPELLEPGRA